MSDENKQILDQVTELISSKKESLKENQNESKQDPENTQNLEIEKKKKEITNNSIDLFIKKEIQNWIDKNAEKLAKELINEQTKKFLNSFFLHCNISIK